MYLHRANIKRIMNGTESKFKFKKTAKADKNVHIQTEENLFSDVGNEALESENEGKEAEELTEEVLKRKEMNRKKSAKKKK